MCLVGQQLKWLSEFAVLGFPSVRGKKKRKRRKGGAECEGLSVVGCHLCTSLKGVGGCMEVIWSHRRKPYRGYKLIYSNPGPTYLSAIHGTQW